ncbi:MAG: OmpA family protein [Spirochaetaceae bacterium]|nr:OmpA family protein [Spirochaetaceae bacterium]MBQ4554159.1 OmpA family protein [Spirochaetaceae bacterium]
MKKTILAIALVIAMMTTVFAADGGSMYVGLHPQIQLPSLNLSDDGDICSSVGFGAGFELGYQDSNLWSVGFKSGLLFYLPYEDSDATLYSPFGVRLSKEIPASVLVSFVPFIGSGLEYNWTDSDLRPYLETGINMQMFINEKWSAYVGYEAMFTYGGDTILQHGIVFGAKIYPLREKTDLSAIVTKDGDKIKIDVPAIIFDANQATFDAQPINIKRQNKKVLDNVAKILVEYKDYKVTVEAYANAVLGTEEEKPVLLKLSQSRADAVKAQLIQRGIAAARLNAVGKGAKDTGDAVANRRAEFILEK